MLRYKKLTIFVSLLILLIYNIQYNPSFIDFLSRLSRDKHKDYNIIWITAESMKPEHLGAYGYKLPTSPNIDSFSKTGTLFTSCFNPSGWTSENMVSNFTGLYSLTHGVDTREKHAPEEWDLPLEYLKKYGYQVPYLQGFQQDTNFQFIGFSGGIEEQSPVRWLEKNGKNKFMLWVHLLQTHLPYDAPEPHRSMFWKDSFIKNEESRKRVDAVRRYIVIPRGSIEFNRSEDLVPINALYDADVNYMDKHFGEIISTLERLNLRKNTLVIFSADHGEEILEHGFIGHASTAKGGTLHDEIIHVPLIISLPGILPEGKIIDKQVRGIDLMPTIFDILNIQNYPYFAGKSILPIIKNTKENDDRIAYATSSFRGYQELDPNRIKERLFSIRTKDWKLLRHTYEGSLDVEKLYKLSDDPKEQNDLSSTDENQKILMKLQKDLNSWISKSRNTRVELNSSYSSKSYQKWSTKDPYNKLIAPTILRPKNNSELSFKNTKGQVVISWSGSANLNYLAEFDIGDGPQRFSTTIEVTGNELKRVFAESYWNEYIVRYKKFKFRVRLNKEGSDWSEWININIK
jgi:arylsulfatase A-like enzyme